MKKISKRGLRRFKRQTCGVCQSPDKFNFNVPDDLWKRVVPSRYRNKAVCLQCFDELARKERIDYANALDVLYFAGDQAAITFQTISAQNIYEQVP